MAVVFRPSTESWIFQQPAKPRPLWEAWFLRVGLPIYGGRQTGAVSTPSMLRVDYDRWGQTPEDLRQLATSAAHQRTRERFLALYEVTQARAVPRRWRPAPSATRRR